MIEILLDLISLLLKTLGWCFKLMSIGFTCRFIIVVRWGVAVLALLPCTATVNCWSWTHKLILIILVWFLIKRVDSRSFRLLGPKEIILRRRSVPNLLSYKAVFDYLLNTFFFAIVRSSIASEQGIIRTYDNILVEHLNLSIGDVLMILKMIRPVLLVMSLLVPCMQPLMRTLVWVYDLMSC